jgi:hypothetical protein
VTIGPKLFPGLLILIASLSASCGGRSCGSCIASVFEGFNLVAEYPANTKPLDLRPQHVRHFPRVFESGKIYVFQPIGRTDTERIAIETFPARLRKCSAKILEAPRNNGDFGVASLGGPFWGIRFQLGHCVGHLVNKYDRELDAARIGWPSGSRDDYILEIETAKQ